MATTFMRTASLRRLASLGLVLLLLPAFVQSGEQLVYHKIQTDASGNIVPWYSPDPARAYDNAVMSVWKFWKDMKSCPNGVKYYLQHQVWRHPEEDGRGLGGDQIAMALSSWNLLYAYSGDRSIVDDMVYMADFALNNGLSSPGAQWPSLPYPYNSSGVHSGKYDGDMRAGPGYLQPDKAASFAAELVVLYKFTGEGRFLKAAINIADTLAAKITPGDGDHSPWPYRVHAMTGQVSLPYTTNYTGALRLFDDLIRLKQGDAARYAAARDTVGAWLKKYPMRTNKWGPFFEDIPGWSDSEINGDTMAMYLLEHQEWDPGWRESAKAILDWSAATFANYTWAKYGVTAINEQTAYLVPGNSHTSRHASVQLLYAEKTGDLANKPQAIRQLNWATYMVGNDGNNRYPYDDVWLTDGYGDYVRHYLRAMAAAPELSPRDRSHLLRSSSVIQKITYTNQSVVYKTFDDASREVLRTSFKPTAVLAGGRALQRLSTAHDLERKEGYVFEADGDPVGVLRVRHDQSGAVEIAAKPEDAPPECLSQNIMVNQNSSTQIRLRVNYEGPNRLTYTLGGPFHGKIMGTPPEVTYTPAEDYLGTDALTFRASDGSHESDPAQITIRVARPNLARSQGAKPFTTEEPRSGASSVEPLQALTDDDLKTGVAASSAKTTPREISVGVTWPSGQNIRQVVLQQGPVTPAGQGAFIKGFRLQITSDGVNWKDTEDAALSPAPYSWISADMTDYVFTFKASIPCRGVRVTGTVTSALRVREFQVFGGPASIHGLKIEYHPQNQTVAEGGKALFGVRASGAALMTYQWQRSKDKGQNWTNIAGATGSYYETPPVRLEADNGTMIRCNVSDGSAEAASNPATLTVTKQQ